MNKNTVTGNQIEALLKKAKVTVSTVEEKCTVVSVTLENGFVITESSACVDKENYNEAVGRDICIAKIRDKLWELEGYRLQESLYSGGTAVKEPTAKERVERELEDLRGKRERLAGFLYSRKGEGLKVAERYLLNKQLEAMEQYEGILVARLSIWRELPDPSEHRKEALISGVCESKR